MIDPHSASPNQSAALPLPRIACHVIVEQAGQILLLERLKPPFQGMLVVPGGKLEPGEFIGDCAKRELLEETGLVANNLQLKKLLHERSDDPAWQWIIYVYHCTDFSGDLIFDGPEGQLSWYAIDDIPHLNCSPVDQWLYPSVIAQPKGTVTSHQLFFSDPMAYQFCDDN